MDEREQEETPPPPSSSSSGPAGFAAAAVAKSDNVALQESAVPTEGLESKQELPSSSTIVAAPEPTADLRGTKQEEDPSAPLSVVVERQEGEVLDGAAGATPPPPPAGDPMRGSVDEEKGGGAAAADDELPPLEDAMEVVMEDEPTPTVDAPPPPPQPHAFVPPQQQQTTDVDVAAGGAGAIAGTVTAAAPPPPPPNNDVININNSGALATALAEERERQFVELRRERDALHEELARSQERLQTILREHASLQGQLQEQAARGAANLEVIRRVQELEVEIKAMQERNDRLQAEGDRLREEIRYESSP
jgi:hypothetical protein